MKPRWSLGPLVRAGAWALVLGSVGCGAIAVGYATATRRSQAASIPSLTGGRVAADEDYPKTAALPTLELSRDVWKASTPGDRLLCKLGQEPERGGVLKEVQDALGRANLYRDPATTKIRSLPMRAGDVESVTLECTAQKIVLGFNGEAIGPDWVAGLVATNDADPNLLYLHLMGLRRSTGEFLWVYLNVHKAAWKLQASGVAAADLKRYLPANLSGMRAHVTTLLPNIGEFLLLDGAESGLYLTVENEKAAIARFKVAAGEG